MTRFFRYTVLPSPPALTPACAQLRNMAGMDGITTSKEIMKLELFTETLILAGHGSIDSALEPMKLGTYDCLTKPSEIDELIA